mmetsp:Transcript_23865/g.59281  ORF Transcript_23865/g.59281 Transcript_23865/m.59281 type:complete len:208 (+) Transcript_23865:1318-1941(+)
MNLSMGMSCDVARSTSPGTDERDFHPPKAVPFHTRPVTSWKGRVAISWPDAATPMTHETPQPRCAASSASRITLVLPVQSKVKSMPHWKCERSAFTVDSCSDGLMHIVAPNDFASSNLEGLRSMPTMCLAPALAEAWMTARPTAPSPNTATLEPASTLDVFHAAPHPVATPQPSMHTLWRGASMAIFAAEISEITVYSEKVEHPMKW